MGIWIIQILEKFTLESALRNIWSSLKVTIIWVERFRLDTSTSNQWQLKFISNLNYVPLVLVEFLYFLLSLKYLPTVDFVRCSISGYFILKLWRNFCHEMSFAHLRFNWCCRSGCFIFVRASYSFRFLMYADGIIILRNGILDKSQWPFEWSKTISLLEN